MLFRTAEQAGLVDELPKVFKQTLAACKADARVMLLVRLAGHFETVKGGSEAALEHYLQAYQLKVDDDTIRAHVWRLAAELNAWGLVIRFFELMTDLTHDRAERFHFLSQRAYVEHEYVGDTESAFSTLKRAVALMPSDSDARTRLEDWARVGQLPDVAESMK